MDEYENHSAAYWRMMQNRIRQQSESIFGVGESTLSSSAWGMGSVKKFTTATIKDRVLTDDGYGSPSSKETTKEIRDYKTDMFIGEDGVITERREPNDPENNRP